jgi:hypothetical protein
MDSRLVPHVTDHLLPTDLSPYPHRVLFFGKTELNFPLEIISAYSLLLRSVAHIPLFPTKISRKTPARTMARVTSSEFRSARKISATGNENNDIAR